MSTWRKVGCCLFAAVAVLGAVAAEDQYVRVVFRQGSGTALQFSEIAVYTGDAENGWTRVNLNLSTTSKTDVRQLRPGEYMFVRDPFGTPTSIASTASEGSVKLFDGNRTSKMLVGLSGFNNSVDNQSAWAALTMRLPEGTPRPTAYNFCNGNDGVGSRTPTHWTVEVSHDGIHFGVVDEQLPGTYAPTTLTWFNDGLAQDIDMTPYPFAAEPPEAGAFAVKVEVEDFAKAEPVVTAMFPEGSSRVSIEWSQAEVGPFVEIGAVENPVGTTFVHTNGLALVADRRWYRMTLTDKDGTRSCDAVPFTRFRRLERDPRVTYSGLVKGAILINPTGSYVPFDGKINLNGDLPNPNGVNFERQVHVAGVRVYPRANVPGRLNNKPIYVSRSYEDYSANRIEIARTAVPAADYYFFASSDIDNAYQCCWVEPDNGDIDEFEVYGWEHEEEATANGFVYFDVFDYVSCAPVITATFQAGADRVAIEQSRSENGTYSELVAVEHPAGNALVFTNAFAKVAVKRFYRVKSTYGGTTVVGASKAYTRWRRLERDPANENVRLAKYAYTHTRPFDGNVEDNVDNTGNIGVGVNFNEKVWLAGVRTWPRKGCSGRLEGRRVLVSRTDADAKAGVYTSVSSPIRAVDGRFDFTEVMDQENAYCWCYIKPELGDVAEMQIYGWDTADIEAAHEPVFPTRLTVVSGAEEGSADMTWEGAHFIESFKVEYRVQGTDAWTTDVDVDGTNTAVTVNGLVNGTTYEFRLRGVAEDGTVDYSPVTASLVFKYPPAGGTGLNALLMGNCDLTLASEPNQFFEKRVFAGIDFNQTESLFDEEAHTNKTTALVSFRGEIEIPVDGTYTLRLDAESNDGIALAVDGTQQFNKNACGGFGSAELALTAGRHGIEIDWLNKTAQKTCRLTWTCAGVFAAETVPASQLFPAADAALPVYDRLDDVQFRVQSGQPMSRLEFDGTTYRIFRGSASNVGGRPALPSLTKVMRGKFIVEATFLSGDPCFIVASTNTVDYQAIEYANGHVRTRGSTSKGNNGSSGSDVPNGPISNGFPGAGFAYPNQMRIERIEDNVIEFKVRKEGVSKRKEWVTICSKTNGLWGANLSDKALRVGFGALGMGSELKLKDLRFRKPGGTVLFVR